MDQNAANGPGAPAEALPPGWNRPLPHTLPRPTAWPAVLAFGTCLLAWGVVTSWLIAGLGLILFGAGGVGWIMEMRKDR